MATLTDLTPEERRAMRINADGTRNIDIAREAFFQRFEEAADPAAAKSEHFTRIINSRWSRVRAERAAAAAAESEKQAAEAEKRASLIATLTGLADTAAERGDLQLERTIRAHLDDLGPEADAEAAPNDG